MLWLPKRVPSASASVSLLAAAASAIGVLAAGAAHAQVDVTEPASQTATAVTANSVLADLRRTRDAFLDARDFSAALGPAQTVVAAQESEREPEYPADLATLGAILGELRSMEPAIANLAEAVELVEALEGPYAPTLVEYYRSIGRAYIKGGKYPEAIASLEQAQHISQRNLGLFNVEQAGVLDDITTAYLGLGDTIEARKTQIERLDNALRRFGATDPRVIPFRYVLANYYERSRLPESAREQYAEVLKSQETRLGTSDAGLLAPLRELASLDLTISQGEDSSQRDRLVTVLEQNEAADPIERGLTLALLGDWAIVKGDVAGARDYYQRAWGAFAERPEFDATERFAKPEMLDFVAPLSPVDRAERRRPYSWGELVFELDVSANGLPSNVRLANRDARTVSLQARYLRRVRETHFRPRLVNGEPVETTNVRSTHYVRYYVEDDE